MEPMLGMFCKLAARHVHTYVKGACEDGHQNLERSGIITELMRMRDFCFVLRDRAKAALDVAQMRIADSSGVIQDSFIQEHMRRYGTTPTHPPPLSTNMDTDSHSNNHNDESRAAVVDAFEASFPKPLTTSNVYPPQPTMSGATYVASPDLSPSITTPEAQHLLPSTSDGANGYSFEKTYDASTENFMNQEVSMQDESGIWNWWDLIEMDIDSNKQVS
jgi:hypothetical protein